MVLIIVGRGPPDLRYWPPGHAVASPMAMRCFFTAWRGPVAGLSHQLNSRVMTGRRGETVVACQQRGVERFGQRDIDSIIGREVIPQIPNARKKKIMRVTPQWKIRKIGERRAPAFTIDLAFCRIPADHLRDFDVEQIRRVQRFQRIE